MSAVLELAARQGRMLLILGLLAGIGLPGLAAALRPWIGEMIAVLMFLAALRIGPRQALGAARDLRLTLVLVLLFQLCMPLLVAASFLGLGWSGTLATALVLVVAASPITGSPNLTMMTGHDPAPALRLLIAGTALLPLTVLPVFWLMPELSDASQVLAAAGRLLLIILGATGIAFLFHGVLMRKGGADASAAIDGASAIAMGVVVVGLMSAVGPAIRHDPSGLALNLMIAFAINFGLQIAVVIVLQALRKNHIAVPVAVVAGNRNMALFLTALPVAIMDPLLLFIGCYQIPMYLTPTLLGPLFRRIEAANAALPR